MNLIKLKEIFLNFKKDVIRVENKYIIDVKIIKIIEIIIRRYRRIKFINQYRDNKYFQIAK